MENLKEGENAENWEKLNDVQKNEISAVVRIKLLNSGLIKNNPLIEIVREHLTLLSPKVILYRPDKTERALRLANKSWQLLEDYLIVHKIKKFS